MLMNVSLALGLFVAALVAMAIAWSCINKSRTAFVTLEEEKTGGKVASDKSKVAVGDK